MGHYNNAHLLQKNKRKTSQSRKINIFSVIFNVAAAAVVVEAEKLELILTRKPTPVTKCRTQTANRQNLAVCGLCPVISDITGYAIKSRYTVSKRTTTLFAPVRINDVPGVPKKRYPCFNFAITSVNVHRF